MYSWMTGDVEASSIAILAASGILLKARYSRGHESEADRYSLEKMLSNNVNPNHFAVIMQRLEDHHKSEQLKSQPHLDEDKDNEQSKNSEDTNEPAKDQPAQRAKKENLVILDYLSSHPATNERVKIFKEASVKNGYKN